MQDHSHNKKVKEKKQVEKSHRSFNVCRGSRERGGNNAAFRERLAGERSREQLLAGEGSRHQLLAGERSCE